MAVSAVGAAPEWSFLVDVCAATDAVMKTGNATTDATSVAIFKPWGIAECASQGPCPQDFRDLAQERRAARDREPTRVVRAARQDASRMAIR